MRDDLTDPINSTSADVSRRGFATFATGAAFWVANAGAAAAQTADFGKPHPPIVAPDDPAIRQADQQITPPVGGPIPAYVAHPRALTRTTPGVVVIQQIWGVDTQLRDVVRRLAKAGYVAIAPALFGRLNPPDGSGATDYTQFAAIAQKMNAQGFVETDVLAARDDIAQLIPGGKIGIMGFCMGGSITLKEIIGRTNFAAASMFYGSVRPGTASDAPTTASTFDFTKNVTTPLMGSFGARDTSIKPADVTAMFARLNVPHDLKIYDEAGHAFFDDTRERYVATAAADAWTRLLAWFQRYLSA
ncbi:MAG TPA: dienelactone hydrolase family protein [Candidatus Sulfotelmatobacter sp.]|nr:dienelactone hydrolase family protein [Candidatus Sulfotelmatobacter sp.]